ncbi:MAG TPA: hypothetical protein VND22_03945 [Actinomycetota bacterium]|nr:hypothetical protein [Actinomycetota bacterium]
MAKTSKKAPPRKPVKARGALPTPRVAPRRRPRVVWYRRRWTQVLAALVLVGMIAGTASVALAARKRGEERKDQLEEINKFDRAAQLLQSPLQPVVQSMNEAPQSFQIGLMTAEDFQAQTDTWIAEFRKLDQGLRKRKIPAGMRGLEEARASMVQGTVIYIDAAKQFKVAALIPDQTGRDLALQNGNALISHATAVYGMGQRTLAKEKQRLGAKLPEGQENPLTGPIPLPEENPPPPPPPEFPAPPEGAQPIPEELPAP